MVSYATCKQRKILAEKTGLDGSQILIHKFAYMADLYRIKGVGSEYAELIEAACVDFVPELAKKKAANLAKAVASVNEIKKVCPCGTEPKAGNERDRAGQVLARSAQVLNFP
mgnify:CR=1 FL=1